MKASRRFLFVVGTALVVLAGISFHKVALAQSQQTPQWMLDEAKLPPDVHPDTLSRMPRPQESDYATDDEKVRFNRIMHRNVTQSKMRWLGPTGTKVLIPELAGGGDVDRPPAADASDRVAEGDPVDLKYHELAAAAVTRELNDRDEFLNHLQDGVKQYGMEMEMAVINEKDTKGMDPKAAAITEFSRDLFKFPRTGPVSSKALADLESAFGRRGALEVVSVAMTYDASSILLRAYDQHMDTDPDCLPGGHHGCLDLKNPPPAWEIPATFKPVKEETWAEWLAEEAKLPPDIHLDTLSRMPRPQESDFASDKDKETFNKVMHRNPTQDKMRWLGPTGTRILVPQLAVNAERENQAIHMKGGVDPKYMELTVAVATREDGNREEFINHEDDAIKAYGKDLEDVVRLRKSTQKLDDPKAAAIIEFGRDIFKMPRVEPPSSKHFADLEQNFGKRGTLAIISLMAYYDSNWTLMRAYDQHMDTNADCLPGGHHGCLDLKNPPPAW